VRPAVALRRRTHSDTDQTQNAPVWRDWRSSRLNSHRHTRHNKTKQSYLCRVWRGGVNLAFVHISLICNATHHLPTTTENIVTTLLQKLSVKRQGALLCQSKSCQLLHNCKDHLYNKSTTNQSTGVEQKSIDRWCIVTEFQTLIS